MTTTSPITSGLQEGDTVAYTASSTSSGSADGHDVGGMTVVAQRGTVQRRRPAAAAAAGGGGPQ